MITFQDVIDHICDCINKGEDDYMKQSTFEIIKQWKEQDPIATQTLYQHPAFARLMNEVQDEVKIKKEMG